MSKTKMPASLPDPIINENAKIVLARRYQKKDAEGIVYETVKELFWRVASAIAAEEAKYDGSSCKPATLARDFYDLMTSYSFLPNSPTLMNAGTGLG
ncbi:ribonucleotide reductase N-terminal alpha domain-containing protein, partial [Pseudodesulfovibrio aespoeensis]